MSKKKKVTKGNPARRTALTPSEHKEFEAYLNSREPGVPIMIEKMVDMLLLKAVTIRRDMMDTQGDWLRFVLEEIAPMMRMAGASVNEDDATEQGLIMASAVIGYLIRQQGEMVKEVAELHGTTL